MPLEDDLHCEGYFGFGGGYVWGKKHPHGPPHGEDRESYCHSLCAKREPCWWRHKGRVMFLFPAGTAAFQGLVHDPENPRQGPEVIEAWVKKYGPRPDPFLQVMAGNLEDGMAVALTGRPKDRGPFTLRFPFPKDREGP